MLCISSKTPGMDAITSVLWIMVVASTSLAQDKIPTTMVTTKPSDADSVTPYPEYWCYVSSADTDATVTNSRVINMRGSLMRLNLQPPEPVRVMDRPYPANSAVYNVPLDFGDNSDDVAYGVFSCDAVRAGRARTRVSNVIMLRGTFSFPGDGLVTQTVNAGDTDEYISMSRDIEIPRRAITSWRRDGNRINDGQDFSFTSDNFRIYFIPEIFKEKHEGIYVPDHENAGSSAARGIQRLIVRSCPANRWAPPECYGVCDYCYNGGVCDDETGRCICAPGFMGENCLTVCGGNRFGPSCEFQCSYEDDADDGSCSGLQFCLVDPYGCRCNTGWRRLDCEEACPSHLFGASCLQLCNCDGICDRFTGACNGTCRAGWTGRNCQIPEVCPTGYYGANCTEKCYCKDDVDCDETTGECPNQECGPTHMVLPGSVKCQECQGPFYGEACSQPCRCAEEDCDKVSGRCRGPCLTQWVDAFFCLAGLRAMSSPGFNPGTSTEVRCEIEVYDTSYNDLTVHLSRDPLSVNSSGIEFESRSTAGSTFTANVTDGEILYCLMSNKDDDIVATTSIVAAVLPVLNSPPTLINAGTTHLSVKWMAWDEANDIGDPPILGYIPYYRSIGSSQWINGSSTESLTFIVTNLTTDVIYEFSITAVREGMNGEGPIRSGAQFRTICDVSNTAPVNISAVTEDTDGSVKVSWQKPDNIQCTTGISFFFIYAIKNDEKPVFEGQARGDARSTVIDGLDDGNYTFVVTLVIDSESGFSDMSASLPVKGAAPGPGVSNVSGVIIAVIVILILVVVIVPLVVLWFYRKKTREDIEKRLVGYNQNGITFGATNNLYKEEPTRVVKLGDETESEEEIDEEEEEDVPVRRRSTDVKVSELREFINTNVQSGKLEEEFSRLHHGKQYPWNVAERNENRTKNRFRNMYTYDHSRVVLDKLPNEPGSDYYNASFVMTDEDSKPFIASQGPNKASLDDFWRMIWHQNITTIVMVTNLVEKGKERCLQYWPDQVGSGCMFRDIKVVWEEETEFANYVIRKLQCSHSHEERTVYQLHFVSWPDMGTPRQPTPLITYTKHVKAIHVDSTSPLLVHCSAGVGRTGTFISLYSLLDVVLQEESVNIFSFVEKIRESRVNMIQTGKQYVFLHNCLMEASLTVDTEIGHDQILQLAADESMAAVRKEFEILNLLENDTVVYADYLKKQGGGKRPFSMSEKSYNLTYYVKGNLLNSYKKGDAFVTAKHQHDDIGSLWKLVHSWKCPIMVTLDNETNKPYWPENGSVKYSEVTVHPKGAWSSGPLNLRQFEVTRVDQPDVISLQHVELTSIPARNDIEGLVELVTTVKVALEESATNGPILVLCSDGEGVSGVLCAVLSEVERLENTDKMDVFRTVRDLKETNENIISSEMDYMLCYRIVFAYLQGNSRYQDAL